MASMAALILLCFFEFSGAQLLKLHLEHQQQPGSEVSDSRQSAGLVGWGWL